MFSGEENSAFCSAQLLAAKAQKNPLHDQVPGEANWPQLLSPGVTAPKLQVDIFKMKTGADPGGWGGAASEASSVWKNTQ